MKGILLNRIDARQKYERWDCVVVGQKEPTMGWNQFKTCCFMTGMLKKCCNKWFSGVLYCWCTNFWSLLVLLLLWSSRSVSRKSLCLRQRRMTVIVYHFQSQWGSKLHWKRSLYETGTCCNEVHLWKCKTPQISPFGTFRQLATGRIVLSKLCSWVPAINILKRREDLSKEIIEKVR